ncbi:hypothetical protein P692DRAFT_20876464 [Suillus brevipes Sb2]|nr:hypothetical protein P692DRAFT_20876464 [Suillus brevipes Sb2]
MGHITAPSYVATHTHSSVPVFEHVSFFVCVTKGAYIRCIFTSQRFPFSELLGPDSVHIAELELEWEQSQGLSSSSLARASLGNRSSSPVLSPPQSTAPSSSSSRSDLYAPPSSPESHSHSSPALESHLSSLPLSLSTSTTSPALFTPILKAPSRSLPTHHFRRSGAAQGRFRYGNPTCGSYAPTAAEEEVAGTLADIMG